MHIAGTRESVDARHKGFVRGLYTSQDNPPLSADSGMLPEYSDSEVQSISKCLDYIVTICLVAFISYWLF